MRDFGRLDRPPGHLTAPALAWVVALTLALVGCGAAADPPPGQPDPAAFRAFTEAGLLERQGRLHDAAARYDAATALDPDAPSLWLAAAIRTEASLAFVGLGVKPPIPTWGGMIREGFENILDSAWLAIMPGIAILVVVFALNLLGDGLRDAIDPKLRGE